MVGSGAVGVRRGEQMVLQDVQTTHGVSGTGGEFNGAVTERRSGAGELGGLLAGVEGVERQGEADVTEGKECSDEGEEMLRR